MLGADFWRESGSSDRRSLLAFSRFQMAVQTEDTESLNMVAIAAYGNLTG
jgi:hypothetical protein